jgi:NADH:ubiquinone oxidoreductase subunit C
MNISSILDALGERWTLEVRTVPIDETFVTLRPDWVRPAAQMLIEQYGLRHLSTITGQDTGQEIQLLYHFWDGGGLTLCTSLPKEDPGIATLTDLIPGAAFYEREISEMLHVSFAGHPPHPLFLPDDWNGEAPLRSEFAAPAPEQEGEG